MKVIYLIVGGLLFLVLAVYFLNLTPSLTQNIKQSQELTPVKIGYMPFASNWPVFLATEKKFFETEGLKVELVQFTSGVDAANAVIKGDIASMVVNPLGDLFNIESRTPGLIKMYAMQQSSSESGYIDTLITRKNSNIKSLKDLKGKRIGVNPGTVAETLTRMVLEKEGLLTQDVEIIKLTPNLHLQSLESGQIDALVAYEPVTTLALENGIGEILLRHPFETIMDPFPSVGFTLSSSLMKDNPGLAEKIIRVIGKSITYGRTNRPEVDKSIIKYVDIPEHLLSKLNLPQQVLGKEINKKRVQEVADLYLEKGLISKKINVESLFYVLDEKGQ